MSKKAQLYEGLILNTKRKITEELNRLIDKLVLPNMDYVELPKRIRIISSLGEELDDCIIAIKKDQAIMTTLFNDTTPDLVSLNIETLVEILNQMENY